MVIIDKQLNVNYSHIESTTVRYRLICCKKIVRSIVKKKEKKRERGTIYSKRGLFAGGAGKI